MKEYEEIKAKLKEKLDEILFPDDNTSNSAMSFNCGARAMFNYACSIFLPYMMEKEKGAKSDD